MRYEGCDSDAATSPRRRREICRSSFACISPWTIFLRGLNVGKFRFSKTKLTKISNWGKGKGKGKIGGDLDVVEMKPSSFSSTEFFSEIEKEASMNLGVDFGVVYLVRNEVNKMVELRRRIESLLQQFQTEIENQDGVPSRSSISSSSSSLPKPRLQEIMYAHEEHDRIRSVQCSSPDDDVISNSNRHGFRRDRSLIMDQLEAELEAEFDRLHLPMDDGEFSYPENADGELVCYEEVGGEFCGVSPRELESKLHQVLQSRQQERIEELESALDEAMRQIQEKERELSMWRDAAGLCTFPPSPPC